MSDKKIICDRCGDELNKSARFCERCGFRSQDKLSFYERHKKKIRLVLIFVFLVYLPFTILSSFFGELGGELERQAQEDKLISGTGEDVIALLNFDGVILETSGGSGLFELTDETTSARRLKKILREIRADEDVKGLLIRVNSPGGTAAGAEEILRELKDFKIETELPIVFYFTDMATSGAYYVAMAGDEIVANPSTITGSIGVIISYLSVRELAENYGVQHIVYKSGEFKDLTNPFSDPSEGEQVIIGQVVEDAFQNFREAVTEGRGLTESEFLEIGDGRILSARQALDSDLIDQIGHFEDAAESVRRLAEIEEARVIEYGRSGFFESLLGSIGKGISLNTSPILGNFSIDPLLSSPGLRVWYMYSL